MGASRRAAGPFAASQRGADPLSLPRNIAIAPVSSALVTRGAATPASGAQRRTKIWEFNNNLHCSIIGTCLSTGELRQTIKKLGLAPPDATDHDLHATAVTLAQRHDAASKLLNKALDQRHAFCARMRFKTVPAS
jgi:hypothetical protein